MSVFTLEELLDHYFLLGFISREQTQEVHRYAADQNRIP
jgi:hypothetical protein